MCGIVGKVSFRQGQHIQREDIITMAENVHHRGPDDAGFYISKKKHVGLGHQRLSIIDLSAAGHQPMCNEDGSIWIVFNGEIYNFQSLRQPLVEKGHIFKSHTDTEVIIHLYEEYGEDCLQYLRGMFAFAIWDEKKQKLFLARDRLGKKPLKYYIGDHFLVFASELKAFIDMPGVPREIDEEAIHHYLTFQYVPSPMTGFKEIKKLSPAHFLTVDLSHSTPKIHESQYWHLDYGYKRNLTIPEWEELFTEKFNESVRMRMIADVPLGVFLSGGLDSSLVVSSLAESSSRPIKTFSIGFGYEKYNELPVAQKVASQFQTDHTVLSVQPDIIDLIPRLAYSYEEPYADSSAIPTYYISKLAREHVTVVLNGDGGDENFAGYPWHFYHKLSTQFERMPLFLRQLLAGNRQLLSLLEHHSTSARRLSIFIQSLKLPRAQRYLLYFTSSYFTSWEKRNLYTDAFQRDCKNFSSERLLQILYQTSSSDPVDQALGTDIHSYLPDDLLVKVDIATMMNSLEARSPFLDHELVELVASMPSHLKLHGRQGKFFIRNLAKNRLPDAVTRGKKKGFMVPLGYWLNGELHSYLKDILLNPQAHIHRYIRPEAIRHLILEHSYGKIDHGSRLWSLLMLEHWFKNYFRA